MGKETLKDKIISWYWHQMRKMRKMMNYTLKNHGYDSRIYYMEELEKMYTKHKDKLKEVKLTKKG